VLTLFYEQENYVMHVAKLIFYRALLVEDRKPCLNVYSFGHQRSIAVHRLTVRIYVGPYSLQ
jgi:hypothetical protein